MVGGSVGNCTASSEGNDAFGGGVQVNAGEATLEAVEVLLMETVETAGPVELVVQEDGLREKVVELWESIKMEPLTAIVKLPPEVLEEMWPLRERVAVIQGQATVAMVATVIS